MKVIRQHNLRVNQIFSVWLEGLVDIYAHSSGTQLKHYDSRENSQSRELYFTVKLLAFTAVGPSVD